MTFDLIIRGGNVVDGSGAPPCRADVGIVGDRVAEIGKIDERGVIEFDADGHVVCPGFVDGHTHMDAQLFWDPLGSCACWHGVTSVVMGNCGFTLAPADPSARELVVANLEKAEDISADVMAAGIDWSWTSFPEFLDSVAGQPKAINYASQIGHSAIRTFVMGERAFNQQASDEDMKSMSSILSEALEAGAIGFTTSISDHHSTLGGMPVASRSATWGEICDLVGVMSRAGVGIFQLATETAVTDSRDLTVAMEFYERLSQLAVSTQVPITFGMRRQHLGEQLALFDEVAGHGGTMFGQTRSEGFSQILSFKAHLPFDRLPEWRELRSRPLSDQSQMLRDPFTRTRLIRSANDATSNALGRYDAEAGLVDFPPYETIEVMRDPNGNNRTVAEIAHERQCSPIEAFIDLALESQFEQVFGRFMSWSDEDMVTVMKHPRTVMTFSDAGAHVGNILSSSIQTRMLSHWVRERGDFELHEAVRMLTAIPALAWGIRDRGILRPGMIADINIFDPETIAPGVPSVEFDLPTGAPRVKQKALGIISTIVGGKETFSNGEHTGQLNGQLLRGNHTNRQRSR